MITTVKPSTEKIWAQIEDTCQAQAFLLCRLKYQYTTLNFYRKCGWEGVLIYNYLNFSNFLWTIYSYHIKKCVEAFCMF